MGASVRPNGMSSAAAALRYWERRQEVAANNLANVSTDGFKGQKVFATMVEGALPAASAVTDFSQGTLQITNNPRDVALQGNGFFVVKTPNGELDLDGVHHLRWSSRALTRVDRSTDYPVGDGFYDVALYSVAAEVIDIQSPDSRSAVKVRFNTERLGWQRIEGVDPSSAFGAKPVAGALPH